MSDFDKELERIEHGEGWNKSDEVVQVEVKKPLDKVVPVRLLATDWAKLREEARELGVGPTTLARMWILERLRLRSISSQEAFRLSKLLFPSAFPESILSTLTPRQTDILQYISQSYINKQVAERLGVSEDTLEADLKAIVRKLNEKREKVT